MVYSARSFFVTVEPLDDGEYEIADLERTFVTDGCHGCHAIPKVYDIALDYFSNKNHGAFRIVLIQDMGAVLVSGPRPPVESE